MSKKPRSKGPEDVRRALDRGDPGPVRALFTRNQEAATRELVIALPPGRQVAPALVATAVELTGKMRREGNLDGARALAEAGAHLSRVMTLELALVALAQGDVDAAARAAKKDAEVARLVEPLVALSRGEDVTVDDALAPVPRALATAARAAAQAGRGDVAGAKATAASIAAAQRGVVFADAVGAAIAFAAGDPSPEQLGAFAASPACNDARVRRAAVEELEATAPAAARELATRLGLGAHLDRRAAVREIVGVVDADLVMELACDHGPELFDPEDRAAALMFAGYGLLATDLARAEARAAEAAEAGADAVEVARLRLTIALERVAATSRARAKPEHVIACGRAADELAAVLEADGAHNALFITGAAVLAVEEFIETRRHADATRSLERAARHARPRAANAIERLRAEVTSLEDIPRARAMLDELLARAPGERAAWLFRIGLTDARAEVRALGQAAARGTGDPWFEHFGLTNAERPVPGVDDLVPGEAGPGAMALHLLATYGGGDEVPGSALLERCRDELEPEDVALFDCAAIAIARLRGASPERFWELAEAALDDAADDPDTIDEIILVLTVVGAEDEILRRIGDLKDKGLAGELDVTFAAAIDRAPTPELQAALEASHRVLGRDAMRDLRASFADAKAMLFDGRLNDALDSELAVLEGGFKDTFSLREVLMEVDARMSAELDAEGEKGR